MSFWDSKNWLLQKIDAPSTEGAILRSRQVHAFLLLGTFLHELGHHVDRISTRSQVDESNGEPFAIAYELRRQKELWPAYIEEFGEID